MGADPGRPLSRGSPEAYTLTMMGDSPHDPIARNGVAAQLNAESGQVRLEYLRTELALSFLLAGLAEDEYRTGKRTAHSPVRKRATQHWSLSSLT